MWPLQKPVPSQGGSTGGSHPALRARCLQHPSTGKKEGQDLIAKLLGLIERQIFVSCQKFRDLAETLSPSGRSGSLASNWAKVQPREMRECKLAPLTSNAQSWEVNATLKENKIAP